MWLENSKKCSTYLKILYNLFNIVFKSGTGIQDQNYLVHKPFLEYII